MRADELGEVRLLVVFLPKLVAHHPPPMRGGWFSQCTTVVGVRCRSGSSERNEKAPMRMEIRKKERYCLLKTNFVMIVATFILCAIFEAARMRLTSFFRFGLSVFGSIGSHQFTSYLSFPSSNIS